MTVMKRFFIGVLFVTGLLLLGKYSLSVSNTISGDEMIHFYNWGDYIDPEILDDFESESGYSVIYETFDSNEAMLTKVRQGGTSYDVIVPSEYMVETMIEDDLLLPLNHDLLPNVKHIDPQFIDMVYDPKNMYSIPYFWGTLGIVYNVKELGELTFDSWGELWNPNYSNEILMIDGAREVLGIGLQTLGYSLNDKNEAHLIEATKKMKSLMPNIKGLVTDEMKMHLTNGEALIGVTYSGEAVVAMEMNENLEYVVPKEGSNIWTDNLSIPKGADNIEGAHALIDFLSRPEIAARNAEYIGYATPNETALGLLDEEIINDSSNYPTDEVIENLEFYESLGKSTLVRYNDLYLEIKIEPRD